MTQLFELPGGEFVTEGDTEWFIIKNYDQLDPFLVTVVTSDDQWMYVSSSGALTAGRRTAELSLFPYETDDRLHRAGGLTGPLTLVRVDGELWEPFAVSTPLGEVERSLSKTIAGDRLRFSERNPQLGLTFSYEWTTAGEFGAVRTCQLVVDSNGPDVEAEVLDGLVNILPAGVELSTQQGSSTLVDAYRRSEMEGTTSLALFTMEALVSDKADPAEALQATSVWQVGLDNPTIALSERQVRRFRSGDAIEPEPLATGRKGAYLVAAKVTATPDRPAIWSQVADVGHDHPSVARLRRRLLDPRLQTSLDVAIETSHEALLEIIATADGLQHSGDSRSSVHHMANVLFNCMRGGSFTTDHRVKIADVDRFIARRNLAAHGRFEPITASLDSVVEIKTLRAAVKNDVDLSRLVNEYLPLTFSRRHGDPSRPWNKFQISTRSADGTWAIGYQGNWRDIFQNWEALMHSFPLYFESAIAKFLNASTLDGNNPYRITDDGIDWEVPEEGSWGNFGYWGDHQIVYLHRLLEAARRFEPDLLPEQLGRVNFSYGDVPYRIRPFDELVDDPKHTIDFDHHSQLQIEKRVQAVGFDGRLVADGERVHHASLTEKLLVPALAKLSSLVAGAGIWMNTQRPEWNDANNALVGNGVSTVTAFHLHEYLLGLTELLGQSPVSEFPLGSRVAQWMNELHGAFETHGALSDPANIGPQSRRSLLNDLGEAYSRYRVEAYSTGPGSSTPTPVADILAFIDAAMSHLDAVIASAARPDGLYHSYWLVDLSDADRAEVEPLYVMLEGQVAALGMSDLGPDRAIELVDSLYASELYRPDQNSFVLYPNRRPAPFMEKNRVPADAVSPAVLAVADGPSDLIHRDVDGGLRFDSRLRSARELLVEIDGFSPTERDELLTAFEATFDHHSFTGRSQTMYKYEGLGSIYWHMVSKLLFAVQEKIAAAVADGAPTETIETMSAHYHRLRQGLGFMKSVEEQGTFPTDPHSHTPAHLGAQQPGMTGQVKEGVLIRWGELGVRVEDGCVHFAPSLLDPKEFLETAQWWDQIDGPLEAGTLGFTYCGVPVVYSHGTSPVGSCTAIWTDGNQTSGTTGFDRATSSALFSRTGLIRRINVELGGVSSRSD